MIDVNNAVYLLAASYRRYDNCNPDVGMGWWDEYWVDKALKDLGLEKKDISYDAVVTKMKRDG